MNDSLFIMPEEAKWHSRSVKYWKGNFERLLDIMPEFAKEEYRANGDSSPNPYLKSIVRKPLTAAERPIPVGVVSDSYTLAQHREVAGQCVKGIKQFGIDPSELTFELGLTELGEWMNFRIYFPARYNYMPLDRHELTLRLECFNSVEGSSRLVIMLGWYRFICSNGMVIGETKTELRDIHNKNMILADIPKVIKDCMEMIKREKARLAEWDSIGVTVPQLADWADKAVSESWGIRAACRTYHICTNGTNVEMSKPFERGSATEKTVVVLGEVPGAVKPAKTLYDVSQALSWIATNRNNAEERTAMQGSIPQLIEKLKSA